LGSLCSNLLSLAELLVHDDLVTHEAEEPLSVLAGGNGRNQVSLLLHVLLEEVLQFLLNVEVLQVVNDADVVDELAVLGKELVTRLLRLSESLVQGRAEFNFSGVHTVQSLVQDGTTRHASSSVLGVLLDTEQQRVVHEVELAQDADILPHDLEDLLPVLSSETQPDVLLGHVEQVLILQSLGRLEVGALDQTVDHRSLEVEHAEHVRGVLHRVAHDNKLDRLLVFHLHRVDAVDTRQQGSLVSADSLEVGFLDAAEGKEVALSHSLDDEPLILGEEKETSTLTLRLSGLEHARLVGLGVQTLSQDSVVVAVALAQEGKHIRGVLSHANVLVDDQLLLELHFGRAVFSKRTIPLTVERTLGEHGTDIPFLAVWNLNAVNNESVLVGVVVVHVHVVIVNALRRADSLFRDSRQDDVHKLDVERTHQEGEQGTRVSRRVSSVQIGVLRNDLTPELPEVGAGLPPEDRLPHSDDRHEEASR